VVRIQEEFVMSNKIFKHIWNINSIGLLIIIAYSAFKISQEIYKSFDSSDPYVTGIIVGDKAKKATNLNLNIQQLTLDEAQHIESTDYYFTEVYVADKKISKEMENMLNAANDINHDMFAARINMIFFNSDRSYVKRLLQTNGFIKSFDYGQSYYSKRDTTRKYILYEIALHDSNKDGRINKQDQTSIYMSNMNGNNLVQISPDSILISKYYFAEGNNEVFFESEIEHKDMPLLDNSRFATDRIYYYYNLKTKKFSRFDELDNEFDEIKKLHKKNF
jgi:hypothetical protein